MEHRGDAVAVRPVLFEIERFESLAVASLQFIVKEEAPLAVTAIGHGEDLALLRHLRGIEHGIARFELDALHAAADTPHGRHGIRRKADAHPHARDEQDTLAVVLFDVQHCVAVAQRDRLRPLDAQLVFRGGRALDAALLRIKQVIARIVVRVGGDDALARLKGQKRRKVLRLLIVLRFGYIRCGDRQHCALIGKEPDALRRIGRQKEQRLVLCDCVRVELLCETAAHAQALAYGDGHVLRDGLLLLHAADELARLDDLRAPRIVDAFLDREQLLFDERDELLIRGKDALERLDLVEHSRILLLDEPQLKIREPLKPQVKDGLRLDLREREALHERVLCLLRGLCRADDRDDLVKIVHRDLLPRKNMLPPLRSFKLVSGPSRHDLALVTDIVRNDLLQSHLLRSAARDGDHIHAERALKIRVFEQILQQLFRICILFDLDDRARSHAVALVPDVRDTGKQRLLFLADLKHMLECRRLVHLIGKLRDDDERFPVLLLFKVRFCAHGELAAPRFICLFDLVRRKQIRTRRKIRSGQNPHQLLECNVRVFHLRDDGINRFAGVVRRDIRCKTDRNARRAVHEQIRESPRQQLRLLQCVVKVQRKVDRGLIDVAQEIQRCVRHAGFRVTHRGRGIAVHGAEVAVAVHELHAHIEGLRHTHHGVVHGGIAVRMIFSEAVADDTRALSVRLIGRKPQLQHRKQDASLHGLQTVLDSRQSALQDDVLRVGHHGLVHHVVHAAEDDALFEGFRFLCHARSPLFTPCCSASFQTRSFPY